MRNFGIATTVLAAESYGYDRVRRKLKALKALKAEALKRGFHNDVVKPACENASSPTAATNAANAATNAPPANVKCKLNKKIQDMASGDSTMYTYAEKDTTPQDLKPNGTAFSIGDVMISRKIDRTSWRQIAGEMGLHHCIEIYSRKNNKVYTFGIIQSPKHKCIIQTPDSYWIRCESKKNKTEDFQRKCIHYVVPKDAFTIQERLTELCTNNSLLDIEQLSATHCQTLSNMLKQKFISIKNGRYYQYETTGKYAYIIGGDNCQTFAKKFMYTPEKINDLLK